MFSFLNRAIKFIHLQYAYFRARIVLRKHLRQKYKKKLLLATSSLILHDDPTKTKKILLWLEAAKKLNPSVDSKYRIVGINPGIIFIAIVVSFLFAFKERVPETSIALDIATDGITFQLEQENQQAKGGGKGLVFETRELSITDVIDIVAWEDMSENTKTILDELRAGDKHFDLQFENKSANSNISLTLDDFPPNAEISLRLLNNDSVNNNKGVEKNGNVEWAVKNGSLKGSIQFNNVNLFISSDGEKQGPFPVSGMIPQSMNFRTSKAIGAPIILRTDAVDDFLLHQLSINALSFTEEDPPGSGNFESLIQGGKVHILEIDENIELYEGSPLRIAFSKRMSLLDWLKSLFGIASPEQKSLFERLKIEKRSGDRKNPRIKIAAEGNVQEIKLGYRNYMKDLRPTYFERIYHEKRISFFFSLLGGVWSALWILRRGNNSQSI